MKRTCIDEPRPELAQEERNQVLEYAAYFGLWFDLQTEASS